MVEEVFGAARSNSQIYINEHLTKYYNKLFLMARTAVKQNKLESATTSGGKIRVRIAKGDVPIMISNENQLQSIIGLDEEASTANGEQSQPGPSDITNRRPNRRNNNIVQDKAAGRTSNQRSYSRKRKPSPAESAAQKKSKQNK